MTLPKVWRIFFAVDIKPALKKELGDLITTLKEKSNSQAIRWSNPNNLHITLQFMAQVVSDDVPAILASVRDVIKKEAESTHFYLGKLAVFPNRFRPRVIFIDIDMQDGLLDLSTKIGKGIEAANYEIEKKSFHAHLTLGRIKQPLGIRLQFLDEVECPIQEVITVDEVTLFKSEPKPDGSSYAVIERIGL